MRLTILKKLGKSKNFQSVESKSTKKLFIVIGSVTISIFACILVYYLIFYKSTASSFAMVANARVAFDNGDQRTAVAFLDETISKFPKTVAAYQARFLKADVLINLDNYDEALSLLTKIVNEGKPESIKPLAFVKIIFIYDLKKDYASMIDFSNKFIREYPGHFFVRDIYLNLAECYIRSGAKDEAINIFNEILISFPKTKEAERAKDRLSQIK
ncbi:MAG: tetratricopeptide repeat protein [Endomicrobium sp.]|jgi:TolA-binding protein|nr:tetratricopeptide repeat protein [Endomicrobium sp.]